MNNIKAELNFSLSLLNITPTQI